MQIEKTNGINTTSLPQQPLPVEVQDSLTCTTSVSCNENNLTLTQIASLQREATLTTKPQIAADISVSETIKNISPIEVQSSKSKNCNIAIIITGPFGSGKDTIANQFIKDETSNTKKVVLHTTRQQGPNELNGREYHFIDREKFYELVKNNEFIQWNEFPTGCYGTAKSSVKSVLNSGNDAVFAVGIDVANTLKIGLKNANIPFVEIFVSPVSREELEKPDGIDKAIEILKDRMIKRGRGEKEFEFLIKTAREWLSEAHNFTNVIENPDGKLDAAITSVKELITKKKSEIIPPQIPTEDPATAQFEKYGYIDETFFKLHNLKAKGNVAVIIAGPSGVGKGTILDVAFQDKTLKLTKSLSDTSRPLRPNEKDGVDYHSITKEKFQEKIKNNEFLQWVCGTNQNHYGQNEKRIQDIYDRGENPLFDMDIKGSNFFRYVLKKFNIPVVDIFISPVSKAMLKKPYGIEVAKMVLKDRLLNRGSGETPVQIEDRINKAEEFLKAADSFSYFIENSDGNLEKAREEFINIIERKIAEIKPES